MRAFTKQKLKSSYSIHMDIGFLKTSFGSLSTHTAFPFLEESTASLISCFVICLFSISVSSSGGIMFFWDDIVLMKLLSKHGLLRGTLCIEMLRFQSIVHLAFKNKLF